jgi:hypothetical protein
VVAARPASTEANPCRSASRSRTDIRFVDIDTGEPVGLGERASCGSGPQVMLGYTTISCDPGHLHGRLAPHR